MKMIFLRGSSVKHFPWICFSRQSGRDIAFYPNKIGKKSFQTCSCFMSHVLKKTISRQVSLAQHDSWCPHWWRRPTECTPMKVWRNVEEMKCLTRVHKRCCLTLGIACSYLLSFLRRNLRDPIGRHVTPWRIWLVNCSLTAEEALLCFSGKPKSSVLSDVLCPTYAPLNKQSLLTDLINGCFWK